PISDDQFAGVGKIFLSTGSREGVTARRQLNLKGVRRKGRMHFNRVGVNPISDLIWHGRSVGRGGVGEIPGAVRPPDVEAGGERLLRLGIEDLAAHERGW